MVVLDADGSDSLRNSKVHISCRNHEFSRSAQLHARVGLQRWNILALREEILNGVRVGGISRRRSDRTTLSVENPGSRIDNLHVWMQKEIALFGGHHAMEAQLAGGGIVTQASAQVRHHGIEWIKNRSVRDAI